VRGFMTKADYEGVCHNMRLASGVLWPMPITLGAILTTLMAFVYSKHDTMFDLARWP